MKKKLLVLVSLGIFAASPAFGLTLAETMILQKLEEIRAAEVASGGGGGGTSDATAANQTSQITQATATNTVLGAKTDAKSTATDATSISIMQVLKEISAMLQAPPSQAVTNAGTFATQSVATQKQLTGPPSNFTIGIADAPVFTLAAGEVGRIQNLNTTALAVKYGASASATSFTYILPAGTATDDGKGGVIKIDDWVGVVSVAAMTGSPRFMASKQAP